MLRIAAIFAIIVGVLALTVLSDRPRPPADFTFINRGDVNTLDLQRMSWMQDLRIARCIAEGLVKYDVFTRDFAIVPAVAERWEVSPDRLVYTFHLRPDAKWSNGELVTSHDFAFTWRRGLLPDIASDYVAFFWNIRGGRAFYDWRQNALDAFSDRPLIRHRPFVTLASADLIGVVDDLGDRLTGEVRQELSKAFGWLESDPVASEAHDADVRKKLSRLSRFRTLVTDERRAQAIRLWEETQARFEDTVAISTPNERTFVVELEEPVPYFLDLVAFAIMSPVYPPVVSQYEQPNPETGRLDTELGWTKPGVLVSNGPFMLTEWRFKRDMRLDRNPHYWNASAINIDSMAIPSVEDANAQVLAFRTGAVQFNSDVTPSYRGDILLQKEAFYDEHRDEVDRLRALGLDPIEVDRNLPRDPRKNIHALPAFGTYFYNFNTMPKLPDGRDNPFASAAIRRIFTMAIDKERITRDVRRLGEPVATTLIPPGSIGGYNSPAGLPFDPVRARRELAELGYPNGEGFMTVEILFNKDSGHDVIAQAIAKDWEENLGVSIALRQKEIKVFRNDLKKHDFMTSRAGWFGDYGDPTTFLDICKTDDGNNDRAFSHPEYDALLGRAAATRDPAARMRLLEQAERLLVDEQVPLIPIFHYVQLYLFDPHVVSGISAHPRQQQDMYLIDILGDGKGADVPLSLPPAIGGSGNVRGANG